MSFETRVWSKDTPPVLLATIGHKPQPARETGILRPDVRVHITGPKFATETRPLTFLPEEPARPIRPPRQHVIREMRNHVHDPQWCSGVPKSTTGFMPDLPPLANGVARYDSYSEPPVEDPLTELAWLIGTQNAEIPTTLQQLHDAGLDGTLLTESISDSLAESAPLDLADRVSAPVIRRIEWEQERAQNGRITKFYLNPSGNVTTWSGKDAEGRPAAPEFNADQMQATADRVFAHTAAHGITYDSAMNAKAEMGWRMTQYGRDWLTSYLKPKTITTYFGSIEATRLFWSLHMPDERPYREAFVEDDDDLHRPEEGYESQTTIREIQTVLEEASFGIFDFSYGDLDEDGTFRLDQRWTDILNLASFANDGTVALDVDGTLEERDYSNQLVADGDGRFHYSSWRTRRFTDYRWRNADGSQGWKRVGRFAPERAGNVTLCDCRACRRFLAQRENRRRAAAIVRRWKRRAA